jgi:hypothetical protein
MPTLRVAHFTIEKDIAGSSNLEFDKGCKTTRRCLAGRPFGGFHNQEIKPFGDFYVAQATI